jgi:hypothetical protein
MKTVRFLVPVLLILAQIAVAAQEEPFHVDATVYRNDRLVMKISVEIPRDGEQVIVTRGKLQLEMETSQNPRDDVQLTVRLVDTSRAMPWVLHTARTPGPPSEARSMMYSVCSDRTTFRSPASASPEPCAR